MSTGKYTSLHEAKDQKTLKRFIQEHPSKGNTELFDKLLNKMATSTKKTKGKKDAVR